MSDFFVSLLLQPVLLVFVLVAFLVAGAWLSSRYIPAKEAYRRVKYTFRIAVGYLLFCIVQIGWGYLSLAAGGWLFVPMFVLLMLSFTAFGAFIYYVSASRVLDVSGNATWAWVGFVPVAQLLLVFKRGQAAEMQTPERDIIRDAFFVGLALCATWLGNETMGEIGETSITQRVLFAFEDQAESAEAQVY